MWSRGRHFRVERIDKKRTTFDCGVKAKFKQDNVDDNEMGMLDYCGTIQDIIKVGYRKFDMFIFDVKWFKVISQGPLASIRRDKSGLIQIDSTKLWTNQTDTFVLPEHCEQVIFKADPKDQKWLFVIQIDARAQRIYEEDATIESQEIGAMTHSHEEDNPSEEQDHDEQEVQEIHDAQEVEELEQPIIVEDLQDLEANNVMDEQDDISLHEQEEDIDGEIFLEIDIFGMLDLADDERTNNEDI